VKHGPIGAATHLQCSSDDCNNELPLNKPATVCPKCSSPLLVYYDLDRIRQRTSKRRLAGQPSVMWRYLPWLPFRSRSEVVSLGESTTPLLELKQIGKKMGLPHLVAKDESRLPGGTFKARGMAVAVSRAKQLGQKKLAVPSAGNAGLALAMYANAAGLESHVALPADTPFGIRAAAKLLATSVIEVDGLISDCGRVIESRVETDGWSNLATFKEPYRLEGKKTMGLELFEQLGWQTPDVIVYPTGGGTGLLGIAKAFDELVEMNWIDDDVPRFVAVQPEGCRPVVEAFESGAEICQPYENARTIADGLRVPDPYAGRLILQVLRDSEGTALSVSDDEIRLAQRDLAKTHGYLVGFEAAASLAGCQRLVEMDFVDDDEQVVVILTGGWQGPGDGAELLSSPNSGSPNSRASTSEGEE